MKESVIWCTIIYLTFVSEDYMFYENVYSISIIKYLAPRRISFSVKKTKADNYNDLHSMRCHSRIYALSGYVYYLLVGNALCWISFAYWRAWDSS